MPTGPRPIPTVPHGLPVAREQPADDESGEQEYTRFEDLQPVMDECRDDARDEPGAQRPDHEQDEHCFLVWETEWAMAPLMASHLMPGHVIPSDEGGKQHGNLIGPV